jgi:hypothetical protein
VIYPSSAGRLFLPIFGFLLIVFLFLQGCAGSASRESSGGGAPPPPASISVSVAPATMTVQASQTQTLTATVQNDSASKGVTWAVSGAGCSAAACGSLSAASSASGSGVTYTAPTNVPNPATVTVTATSVADGTKSSATSITITAPPAPIAVALSATSASVLTGATQAFTATVQNDSANKGVSWTLAGSGCSGPTCGTLSTPTSASGAAITYTAPATVPTPATVTLTATSVADNTKSAAATITLMAPPPVGVTLSLASASVMASSTQAFTANVQNDTAGKGVTWTLSGTGCSGAACGTISATSSASGAAITYTAPPSVPTPATVTLTATAVADPTKSAVATITITSGITVALSPKRGGLTVGQSLNFTATVANDVGNQGVTWSVTGGGSFSGSSITGTTYVAPGVAGVVTVTATSAADTTQSASATFGVTDMAGVLTYHNDLTRAGVNSKEYALTTSNVSPSTFGKLFSCPVDGAVYAQPLWVPNISIGGGVHNVIVVATMRDSIYVFDADTPCVTYWNKQLIPAGETYGASSDIISADIYPDIGILGTPVIDPTTNTIYFVTKTRMNSATYHQRLHALNLVTGAEGAGSPVEISGTTITYPGNCEGGTVNAFDPRWQNQRAGLALVNNVVYVAWGSHGDNGTYHGWAAGFRTSDLGVTGILNTSPNTETGKPYCRGGIWMSGGAPAADDTSIYFTTGNGIFDPNSGDFGDSYLKVAPSTLAVTDYFAPYNQDMLDTDDADLGSSGTAVLIQPNLLVGGSKSAVFYVLNRSQLGQNNSTDNVVQEFMVDGPSYCTPAFWNNTLYYFGAQYGATQLGESYTFVPGSGTFVTTPASKTPTGFGFPGATPSVSATPSGTNGILWAMETSHYGTSTWTLNNGGLAAGPAVLHAYDAGNLALELWNSSQTAGGRDQAGNAVKFTVPTIANGKVYIGTRGSDTSNGGGTTFGEIDVYGLLPN